METSTRPDARAQVQRAAEAYLYGYPLVYNLHEMARFPTAANLIRTPVPLNTFGFGRQLLDPHVDFVSPNNDTLYIIAIVDVRQGPFVLHVPATGDRYYVLQFVDAWTNNFAYIGRRATGTAEAHFLLAAHDYQGPVPADVQQVVHAPTGMFAIVGRIAVDGVSDLPAVHALQDQFSLSPYARSQGEGASAAVAGVPQPDARVSADLAWWEQFRVALAAFPPPAADAPFLAICRELGLLDQASPYVNPDAALAQVLVAGQAAAQAKIEELLQSRATTAAGWQNALHVFDYNADYFEVGAINAPQWIIADRKIAYVTRAIAARAGLWGNHGYEADYQIIYVDADGQPLTSDHRYMLHLPVPPPVDAFWSLTMYNVPEFYLVDNSIDRYSIGDRTPGLQYGPDGSLTIYMQKDAPDADKQSNWLPTPQTGAFRPILRMYQPQSSVLDGAYLLPAVQRLD